MKSIIFRSKYVKALEQLSSEKRLEAYDAIMAYVFTGEVKTIHTEIAPLVSMICESIFEDYERYERAVHNGE